MTVSAQQLKVPRVRGPVFESTSPNVAPVFRPDLFARVDMINIQRAVVIEPTPHALATELSNQLRLAHPVARSFIDAMAVFVPIVAPAFIRTESRQTRSPAILAFAGIAPSVSEIACLPAEFTGAIAKAIGVHLRRLPAMRACDFDLGYTHNAIIPKYFDIACSRIDAAYRQGRLFA